MFELILRSYLKDSSINIADTLFKKVDFRRHSLTVNRLYVLHTWYSVIHLYFRKIRLTQHISCTVYTCTIGAREGGRRERARAAPPGVARVQHQRALERVRALLLRAPHAGRVLRAHRFARAPHARARLQTRGTAATRNGLSTYYSSFLLFYFFYG